MRLEPTVSPVPSGSAARPSCFFVALGDSRSASRPQSAGSCCYALRLPFSESLPQSA